MIREFTTRENLPLGSKSGVFKKATDVMVSEKSTVPLDDVRVTRGENVEFAARETNSYRQLDFRNGNSLIQRGGLVELFNSKGHFENRIQTTGIDSPLVSECNPCPSLTVTTRHNSGGEVQVQTQRISSDGSCAVYFANQPNDSYADHWEAFVVTHDGKVEDQAGKRCGKLSSDGSKVQLGGPNQDSGQVVGLAIPHWFYAKGKA